MTSASINSQSSFLGIEKDGHSSEFIPEEKHLNEINLPRQELAPHVNWLSLLLVCWVGMGKIKKKRMPNGNIETKIKNEGGERYLTLNLKKKGERRWRQRLNSEGIFAKLFN